MKRATTSESGGSVSVAPISPRADLGSIWPYIPGRHRRDIEREYGVSDVLKLASNENPLGPSPIAVAALERVLRGTHLYPDSRALELREALADRIGLTVDHVVVGNGSVECIDMVARAFLRPGDEAIVGFPSFPRFVIASQVVGVTPTRIPHREWRFDLDGIERAVTDRTRVVFVDNPCNPTGTHIEPGELSEFLDRLPADVLVVLDRAYYEYVDPEVRYEEDVDRIRAGANLVVLRTFSKAYGLAGVRVGYALGRPEIIGAMNHVREAFNTTSLGQAAALAALDDEDHVSVTVALTNTERVWLAAELARLGFETVPSRANFLFTRFGDRAGEINEGLLRHGVVVRPMTAAEIGEWVRISISTREGNRRLVSALEEVVT